METKKDKILEKNLNSLINIEIGVYKAYLTLENAENQEQYENALENVEFVISIENEYFQKILETIKHTPYGFEKIIKTIKGKDVSEEIKENITNRVICYIIATTYKNPFLSNLANQRDRALNNEEIIRHNCEFDVMRLSLYCLERQIKETTSETDKREKIANRTYYIYSYKILEKYLKEGIPKEDLTSRERCIIFGHNKKLVDKIYSENIMEEINKKIATIQANDLDEYDREIEILNLQTFLNLLTNQERMKIAKEFYFISNNIPNENNEKIAITIAEALNNPIINSETQTTKVYKKQNP